MYNNANITVCLVCSKPYEQVIGETAADGLYQTAQSPNLTKQLEERLIKSRLFTDGLQCGVFTFIPR